MTKKKTKYDIILEDLNIELASAISKFPKFNTEHEGYAIILEELDELWEHIKVNQKYRNKQAMRKEALQTAAMSIRFMIDLC